jgi:hypothetical protein
VHAGEAEGTEEGVTLSRSVGTPRRAALRRYPALGYLAATGALALLLPSGLTVPNSGPPTLAEYAPVPGQGEGQSDTGELGLPTTGGLGAGGRGEGGVGGPPGAPPAGAPDQGELIRKPGSKRCVGNPPRQTEDPLSPPCIAHFEGDNFGSTWTGVTRDEVVVVAEISSVDQSKEVVDCAEPIQEDDLAQDRLCKAYMRFFNDRYQTYGRTVHLYSSHSASPTDVIERYRPFALMQTSTPSRGKERRVLGVGYTSRARKDYQAEAPYQISFRPDVDDLAAIEASYACLKLEGRPARYAGDTAYHSTPRKFGFWTPFPELGELDKAFIAALKDTCGIDVSQTTGMDYKDQTVAARMKAAGVTTVFVTGQSAIVNITTQATQATWFPEWVVHTSSIGLRDISSNFFARTADPLQWRNAVGMNFDLRRPRLDNQSWYRAYKEGCPDCPEISFATERGAVTDAATSYDALSMLFYGIQAAGPRLTPVNIDRGLHAIPPRASTDPFRPAAYFAPGNYTFLKDAMGMWWDPTGTPPGSSERGCWRLAHDGRRFRRGEWLRGDGDLKEPGACQGDVFRG